MITIISPAKNMKKSVDWIKSINCEDVTYPMFYKESNKILKELKGYMAEELAGLMKINEKLSQLNYARFQRIKPMTGDEKGICYKKSPAIFSYDGIQYKNMCIDKMGRDELEFINLHVRILSGFYGVLKPFDMIDEYRLEMQTKLKIGCVNGLYSFWKGMLAENIFNDENTNGVVLNLASKEYSKCIEKYVDDKVKFITCTFKVRKSDKLKVESTASKKGRGSMIKFIADNKINNIEELKRFSEDGFVYSNEESLENELVFIKEG